MMRLRGWTVTALTAAAFALTGGTLTFYEDSQPTTMNPLFAQTMVDRRTHEIVFDRIFYRSAVTSEIKSRLVDSYELLENGAKIKLYLRNDVKWHDGEAFSAKDVCFTVDVMLNEATPSAMAKPFREVLAGCEVEKKDNAAIVAFKRAYHNPHERLSFAVLPAHSFTSTVVMPDNEFAMRPIGTGPAKGSKGRMGVKFESFQNGHHHPQIVEARSSQGGDPLVQIRTLLNAGVHGLITVAPPYRPDVAASDDVALKSYDLRSWWFVALNTNRPALRDAKVRKALDVAINRSELRQLTMGVDPDERLPACQFISGPFIQSSPYYNRAVPYEELSDHKRMRSLMAEAGATEAGGRWVIGGAPVNFKIGMHGPLDLEARDLLNQLANQLNQAGFGQEVYKISADDWVMSVVTGKQVESYDMLIGKWSFGVVEDIEPLFHTRAGGLGSLNIFNYSNAEVDRLLSVWDRAATDTEAQDSYHELHKLLSEDLPYLFLWKLDTKSAWRMEVRNNTITPYFYFTEFAEWQLDE